MDCDFEGIANITAGDYIDLMCNNATSNQAFTTCQIYIQQVINDFQAANSLAGMNDITFNNVNKNVLAYDSVTNKYVFQNANSANLVDKSTAQIIAGTKQFSGSTTTCMINSTSAQIPLIVQNALGTCSLQLSSNGTNSQISQVTDDFQITNSNDGIPFL